MRHHLTIPAKGIVRWDGNSWRSIGKTVPPYRSISTVCAIGNTLYAGGIFDSIGGQSSISIATYNGSSWSPMGAGIRKISTPQSISPYGAVNVIACKDSIIYVGGKFDTAGTIAARNIARWNGSTWESMGAGVNGEVNSMAVLPNGDVVVVSSRDSMTTVLQNNVTIWNGSSWNDLPALPECNSIEALALDSNRIYVGGNFSVDGSDTNRSLAMWDGNAWQSVGGGVWGTVYSLYFYNGSLYVGGKFPCVGSDCLETFNIAKWQVRTPDTARINNSQSGAIVIRSYPNPSTSDNIVVEFTLLESGVTSIQIISAQGEVLEQLSAQQYEAGTHKIEWNIDKKLSSQVLYCRVTQNGRVTVNNIVLER